jgi:NTP pyrophosphatase (non-canonical NTP hydrolase)
MKIRNNVNLDIDMFKLRGKYNAKYWEENQILTLTAEMQEFINKVNSSNEKSDFKSKSNMK